MSTRPAHRAHAGFTLVEVLIALSLLALLMLVLGLPIADVAWQIFDRARNGRNPTRGDRGHLHFRLADAGWSAGRCRCAARPRPHGARPRQ